MRPHETATLGSNNFGGVATELPIGAFSLYEACVRWWNGAAVGGSPNVSNERPTSLREDPVTPISRPLAERLSRRDGRMGYVARVRAA